MHKVYIFTKFLCLIRDVSSISNDLFVVSVKLMTTRKKDKLTIETYVEVVMVVELFIITS